MLMQYGCCFYKKILTHNICLTKVSCHKISRSTINLLFNATSQKERIKEGDTARGGGILKLGWNKRDKKPMNSVIVNLLYTIALSR